MKRAHLAFDSPDDMHGYENIVKLFGNILIAGEDGSYQGDAYVLVVKGTSFGYVTYGFGFCSGCDALEGCSTFEQADELIDAIEGCIHWEETLEGMQEYLLSEDRKASYFYGESGFRKFKEKVAALTLEEVGIKVIKGDC